MTDEERRIADILVNRGETGDCWSEPIHTVSEAMRWDTAKSKEFVRGMVTKGFVRPVPKTAATLLYDPKCRWEMVDEETG